MISSFFITLTMLNVNYEKRRCFIEWRQRKM